MISKVVELRVLITHLHYVGWAKIKTNGHTDVITINNPTYVQAINYCHQTKSNKNALLCRLSWVAGEFSPKEKCCIILATKTLLHNDMKKIVCRKPWRQKACKKEWKERVLEGLQIRNLQKRLVKVRKDLRR